MSNERIVVVHEKPHESTIVKLAKIVALVIASPFILGFSVVAFVTVATIVVALVTSGAGTVSTAAPWLFGAVVVCALLPALQSRVSNKKQVVMLQQKIHALELELSEVRLESIKAHESAEFHRRLNETKATSSGGT